MDILDSHNGAGGVVRVRHRTWNLGFAALAPGAPDAPPATDDHGHILAANAAPAVRLTGGGRLAALISAYPWPYAEALAVARCENRELDPSIISDSGDYGIFQINEVHAGRVDGYLTRLLIAEVNVRVAYEIWSEEGWGPWRSSRRVHGLY